MRFSTVRLLRCDRERALAVSVSLALFVVLTATAAVPAAAGESWVALGVLAGATQPDGDLANYRWDVGGHGAYGLEAFVGHGRWGGGLRWSQWGTRQSTGLLGAETSPTVRITSWQLLARAHAFSVLGVRVLGSVSAGRVHLGYHPDRLLVDDGVSEPVAVDFPPIDEWIAGVGLGVEHDLVSNLSLGAELERTFFSLDTAHRNGGVIEENRESFGNWNLRLRLSWALRMS